MRLLFIITSMLATACAREIRMSDAVPAAVPPATHEEAVAYNASNGVVLLFGGLRVDSSSATGYRPVDVAYEWRDEMWSARPGPGPRGRTAAAMTYHPGERTIYLFGGLVGDSLATTNTFRPCPSCGKVLQLTDLWSYRDGRWAAAGVGPLAYGGTLLHDPSGGNLLMVAFPGLAGRDTPEPVRVWRYERGAWTVVDTIGPRIAKFARASLDVDRGVVVLPILDGPDRGVWEWRDQWRRVDTAELPEPRHRYIVTYDAQLRRTILFGGMHWEPAAHFNDLWAWDGARFERLNDGRGNAPAARSDGAILFQPDRQRLLLIGGLAPGQKLLRETWSFRDGSWTRIE